MVSQGLTWAARHEGHMVRHMAGAKVCQRLPLSDECPHCSLTLQRFKSRPLKSQIANVGYSAEGMALHLCKRRSQVPRAGLSELKNATMTRLQHKQGKSRDDNNLNISPSSRKSIFKFPRCCCCGLTGVHGCIRIQAQNQTVRHKVTVRNFTILSLTTPRMILQQVARSD